MWLFQSPHEIDETPVRVALIVFSRRLPPATGHGCDRGKVEQLVQGRIAARANDVDLGESAYVVDVEGEPRTPFHAGASRGIRILRIAFAPVRVDHGWSAFGEQARRVRNHGRLGHFEACDGAPGSGKLAATLDGLPRTRKQSAQNLHCVCPAQVRLRSPLDGADGVRKAVVGRYAVGSTTAGFARQGPLLIDYRERSSRQLLLGEKMTRAMTSNGFAIGLFLPDRLLGGYGPGCGENHQRECNG